MKKERKKKEIEYTQKALFYNEATRLYIPTTDGAELLVYYTKKSKDSNRLSIFFIPGYASVPMSWNDLWDSLYEDFDLYVLETREKNSSKVKWKHKGDLNRSAQDIKDALDGCKLDPKKTFIICASSSTLYMARALAEKLIDPAGVLMIGPVRTPKLPRKLIVLAYFIPSFVLDGLLTVIGKLWISTVVPKGIQRERYKQYITTSSGMRWKKTMCLTWWDGTEDFKKISCPCWLVGASKEALHSDSETKLIQSFIKGSKYVHVPDFIYMHHLPGAKDFARTIKEIINSIEQSE
ncbi:MAG: hypothetical protein ACTSSF_13440 [Candidatus Heimdallarchaeaceae archaeon]